MNLCHEQIFLSGAPLDPAAVDLLFFAVPSFYDAYTGCRNTFPDIDASFAP